LSTRFALSGVVRFWDRHSAGGCELVKVPGDHMSIMSAPAIGVIAERVRRAIVDYPFSPDPGASQHHTGDGDGLE
jgi:thioesterase domain-containing protein